jgi:hypothetical protein
MEKNLGWLIGGLCVIIIAFFGVGIVLSYNTTLLQKDRSKDISEPNVVPVAVPIITEEVKPAAVVTNHIKTPDPVRAVYMSAWVASTPSIRAKIIQLIDTTTINAVIIDIKDATGRVSFLVDDPIVADTGSPRALITDISGLIETLHAKNIYVIGRISVFQDPYLAEKKPEWAIQSISTGKPWKDRKGLSFLSPTKPEVWNYMEHLAIASHNAGFDEINFDYIRFPSDGNIKDIAYPTGQGTKSDILEKFFVHLGERMRAEGITTSADLFGMTTTNTDDMGIGQVLEKTMPHFDFIAPMIYPSHYPKNFNGYANPAAKPYEIVTIAMKTGVERAVAAGYTASKFRPWIQDFDLGTKYTADMIRDQIRALHEQGIESYMVWDPANTYTVGAYNKTP